MVRRAVVITAPLLALVASGLGGCRQGPWYARPPVDVPATLGEGSQTLGAGSAESAPLADLPWWQVFRDPALQGLLGDALRQNHDLALAAARVDEARALIGLTHSERLPQVNGSLGLSRDLASRELVPLGDRTSTSYAASIGATWEIDLWGRVRRGEEAALADYLASEAGRRAVVVALVADVADGYVRLRTADLLRRITERTIGTRRSTLDLFEKRLGGGLSSRLEVARAAGDLAASEATLPLVEQVIAAQQHRLSFLAGRNPGPVERGLELGAGLLPPLVPAGLPSLLLTRRPDVVAAEQRLRAATARVGVARAEWFPRLSLTGLLGLSSRELDTLVSSDAAVGSLGAELLAPIVSGGRLCANEKAAWARLEQARQVYLQSVRAALRDTADALSAIQRTREARTALESLVAARQEALQMALTRFDGGLASYIEVLDSQRELFPAEIQLAEARRDEILAVIQLYRALGGGWDARHDAVPAGAAATAPAPAPAADAPPAAAPAAAPAAPAAGAQVPPPEPPPGMAAAFPPASPALDPALLPPAGAPPAAPLR